MGGQVPTRLVLICLAMVTVPAALAQSRPVVAETSNVQDSDDQEPVQTQTATTVVEQRLGRVAEASVGEVGQRQTRNQAVGGTRPLARISSRLQTRVQNRLRNRIDRNYDAQANATNPFAIAEAENMSASAPR